MIVLVSLSPRSRLLFRTVHLWVTFAVGLLVVSAGGSGTALVFKDEIDAAFNPTLLRVEPEGEPAPMGEVLASAEAAYPGDRIGLVMTPQQPDESHEVWMQPAGTTATTDLRLVYVDPYTAEVLGARKVTEHLMLVLHYWHAELLFGGTWGKALTALGGLALVVLSLTGLVLWWPKNRKQLRRALTVKRKQPWHRVLYDLHRSVGFYLTPLLLFIAVTGVALVYHDTTEALLTDLTDAPPEPERSTVTVPPDAVPVPVEQLVRTAEAELPDAVTTRLMFPRAPERPFIVRMRFPAELHPNGKTFVVLDPYTGAVLGVRNADPEAAPTGWRLVDALYPVHKGGWGGRWSQFLHAFAGLMVTVFAVTGLVMWWKRTRPRPARRSPISTSEAPRRPRSAVAPSPTPVSTPTS